MNLRWNHNLLLCTKEGINETSIELENKRKFLPSPALSSIPGAKHLICGLILFSKLSVFTNLIVNGHSSQEFQFFTS